MRGVNPETVKPVGGLQNNNFVPPKSSAPQNTPLQSLPLKNSGETLALLKQALFSLGLGQDNLNKALFIFTRFFSLPAGQAANPGGLLKELRRELLNTPEAKTPGEEETEPSPKAALENKALAVTVLADKGVKLSPDAFEAYIRALDPDAEQYGENPGNGQDGNSKDESGQGQNGGGNRKWNNEKEPAPEELRALFDEYMGSADKSTGPKEQVIRLLNAVPGKNGQRWIVWPFSTVINGVELRILVRVLLKEPISAAHGRLIVNVAGPSNSWRFILDKPGQKLKADISVYPERRPSALKALKKEAEKFLAALAPAEIQVKNGEKFPSLADFLEKEALVSINGEA